MSSTADCALRVGVDALFVRPGAHAGGEVALINLLRSLSALREDTQYIVFVDARSEAAFSGLDRVTIVPVRLPRRLPASAARFAWQNTLLRRAVRKHRLDVMFFPANLVPARFPIPTVLVTHDFSSLFYRERLPEVPLSFEKRILDAERVSSCRRADRVLAISEFTAREVSRIAGVSREKMRVVPWGVRALEVPEHARAREIVARYGLTRPFLLSVGSVMPHKNLPRLIEAFALEAHEKLAAVDLVLVGQAGAGNEEVRRAIERNGVAGRVILPGFVPDSDLPAFYRAAHAFVLPSLYEGFGFPVLEAALCGTPVATSNAGSLAEVMGDAAVFFDPWDVRDIAAGLARISSDAALRADLAARGPRRAAEFSWEATARGIAASLWEAAGRKSLDERARYLP